MLGTECGEIRLLSKTFRIVSTIPDRTQPSVSARTDYFRDDAETMLRVTAIEEEGEFVIIANAQKVTSP
jgi:hypothetical protein